MKKKLVSLSLLLTLLLSLGGCKHVDPLTDKIYSIEIEDYVLAMKFLESGDMGWLVFRGISNDEEGETPFWDYDDASFYKWKREGERILLSEDGTTIGEGKLENGAFVFRLFGEGQEVKHFTAREDKRFSKFSYTNKYARKSYKCTTLGDDPLSFHFVDDHIVVLYDESKRRPDMGTYQITEDNHILISAKRNGNDLEAIPEGKTLVLESFGTKHYFRETEFDITEYDILRFKKEIEGNY